MRRLILAPNPEFALFREPGPANQSTSNDFLKQGNVELLELKGLDQFVRCTRCQWAFRPGAIWCEHCKKLVPNIADNAKERIQAAHLHNPQPLASNTLFGYEEREDEKEVLLQKDK